MVKRSASNNTLARAPSSRNDTVAPQKNIALLNNYNSASILNQRLLTENLVANDDKETSANHETRSNIKKAVIAGIKEPTNGFGVSDALYFIPPLMLNEGATSASNIAVSGLTALMLISSAVSRGIVEHAKLSGQDKVLGMDLDKVENSPLILCGLAHVAIGSVMAANGENIHAFMSGFFAVGNILLAEKDLSAKLKEKVIDPFNKLLSKARPQAETQSDLLKTATNIFKTTTYAPLNSSTYFAAGAAFSGQLMDPTILAAAALPYLYAVSQVAKNTQTQFENNMPFPPADGKPVLALGGTLLAVSAANSVQHIYSQVSGSEALNTLSQAQNIETVCAIIGSVVVGITYHRLSQNFESDPSTKPSILETSLKLPEHIQQQADFARNKINSAAQSLRETANQLFGKTQKRIAVNQIQFETSGEADFHYRPLTPEQ